MGRAISTFIAAVAAFTLSGSAYAQNNNTLATPTTVSPAANTTSGYGTPGAAGSDSGMVAVSAKPGMPNSANTYPNADTKPSQANNSLATPSVKSPAAGQ